MAAIRFFTIFFKSVFVILWASLISGENAEAGGYPSVVAIKWTFSNFWRCNGHIISPSWILATASCIHNYEEIEFHVQYGITKLSFYANIVKISKLITHPNYNSETQENGIGLIKLEKDLEFSDLTQTAKLPPQNYIPSVGSICKNVGWFGDANRETILELQVFNATIMSHIDCSEIRNYKVMNTEVCTQHPFGRVNCTLGGGSGLILDNYLYGLHLKGSPSCKATHEPTVYIKISSYYSWIFENIVKYEMKNILNSAELETSETVNRLNTILQSQIPAIYRTSFEVIDL